EPKLLGRAEHAVRFDAADLAALEFQAAGQRGADGSERVLLPRLHVRRTADHLERLAAAGVHLAEREPIGVRVLLHLEDARDEDVTQILMDRHDAIDRRDLASQSISDVSAFGGSLAER